MKHLNFLLKSGSQSRSHSSVTLAMTVGSPSAHRRGTMLRLLSVLVLILTIGVGQMWGATSTLTLSSSNKFDTTSGSTKNSSDNAITWTATTTAGAIQNTYSGTSSGQYDGQQFGTGTTAWTGTFTTSSISSKKVTSVVIVANTGGSATLNVSVGSSTYTTANQSVTKKTGQTGNSYTFSGSSTGDITITVSGTNKAFYLKSIAVTYEDAPTCANKVTLSKGSTANGTFDLDKTDGSYDNCDANFVVHVSNIVPASNAQYCNGINATGGNSTVTGPVNGVWTVTYTKGNNLSSTITPTYANKTAASISFENAGTPAPTTSGYYVGDSYTLPNSNNYSCSGGKAFVGWSTVEVDDTDTKPSSNFYEPGAAVTLAASQTFYAVFANSSSSSSTEEEDYTTNTISSITNSTTNTWNNVGWDVAITWNSSAYISGNQIGSNNNPASSYTISTSAFEGTIKSVTINAKGNSGIAAAFDVSVGGTAYKTSSNETTSSIGISASNHTFLGTSSGEIVITYTPSTMKGMNLYSIAVVYEVENESTTYSAYSTDCCSPLDQINGSVSLTHLLILFIPLFLLILFSLCQRSFLPFL